MISIIMHTHHIQLPNGSRVKTLTRSVVGGGYGTVLLDGGKGGQSSYHSLDDYYKTTNQKPPTKVGLGLDDKIASRLKNLNISKPPKMGKIKNISLNI